MITYLFQTIYLKVHLYPNDLRCHFFHILNFHVIWRLYLDYSVLVYLSVSLLMFHIALIIKALQNILISDKNQSPHTVFLSQCFSTCLCMLFFYLNFSIKLSVFCLGGGYRTIPNCQNASNQTSKIYAFYCMFIPQVKISF